MVTITTKAIARTPMPRLRPTTKISWLSGVFSSGVDCMRVAMWPISVAMPVAVTTARPRPKVATVPLKI
jgi:hypothetical protein